MTKAVLILAGQREGVTDPLCEAADVSHKAEIPIAGVPMLERVIFAITQSGLSDNLYISGYSGSKLKQVSNGKGPADSVALGLAEIDQYPCLITTCDHALLSPDMVQSFVDGAKLAGTDICVWRRKLGLGLGLNMRQDGSVCGAHLITPLIVSVSRLLRFCCRLQKPRLTWISHLIWSWLKQSFKPERHECA